MKTENENEKIVLAPANPNIDVERAEMIIRKAKKKEGEAIIKHLHQQARLGGVSFMAVYLTGEW